MQKNSYTLEEIAKITGSELIGDTSTAINGVESLECASSDQLSFLGNPLYLRDLKKTKAGAVFLSQLPPFTLKTNVLIHPNPSKAFQKAVELFHTTSTQSGFNDIHPTAVIHPSAKIGNGVFIGPNVVIDQGVTIKENTQIYPNTYIGPQTTIGRNCQIYSNVTIRENCTISDQVILQPGAVIGSCGFGYITDERGVHNKLKHVGGVTLEAGVEVGANTTVDRGRFSDTIIKAGTKIDNQVQIGHNVKVGEGSLIISQSGVAGSTTLGKFNVLAGQVGVVGHLKLADHVVIAARGAITKNITTSGRYGGAPALPEEKFYTQQMHFRRLDSYVTKIKELEKTVHQLKESILSNDAPAVID